MGRCVLLGSVAAGVMLLACSCSVTRYVPQGSYLLRENVVEADRNAPKQERIKVEEMEQYVRQTPNKRFLGTNLYLWVYNIAKPGRNTVLARMWRRIGQAPVLLDTTLTRRSAENIRTYMNSRGFFDARAWYEIDTARRKARVVYRAEQGRPYYIGNIRHRFRDEFLRSVILEDSASTLLHTGDVFDINVLDRERLRITEYLKRRGYYNFSINNIGYVADSTVGDHRIDLTMEVRQYLSGYDERGNPQMENNRIYRLRNIYVNADYDPTIAATDSVYRHDLDTLEYRGLKIVYHQKPRVRKEILRRTINLYPNYLYNSDEVKRAYDNIMRLGYYRSANILFTEVRDTAARNLVTFIGDTGGDGEAALTTEEGYLDCTILCTPALRQSYKIELEASTTSNFYGLTATVGYQNRNLFRGVELFDVSVMGGYEFIRMKGRKSSFEVGGTTSISFPRFIAPFRIDRFNRLSNPRTKFELSVNSQRRPYYHRTLSGVTWGYSWGNGRHSSYTLRPVDVNLVKMSYIDEDFLSQQRNPYLRNSYTSQLIAGISGSYVYNSQMSRVDVDRNSLALRINWETTGNLIGALTHLFSSPAEGEDYYKLFGIRYSQYFRVDANLSNKIVLDPRNSLVYRLYAGVGHSYGNSTALPFDRLFYCGGSNSMRGWLARTLGPGNAPLPEDRSYPSQLGNLKLEANLEYRFPVWGVLNGALFFDAGNIWFLKGGDADPDGVFRFDRFWSQLGFNTGLGARFDFNFFVVRVDWGIKLHDPNQPSGQRWIHDFRFRNTALNFGVGYPF